MQLPDYEGAMARASLFYKELDLQGFEYHGTMHLEDITKSFLMLVAGHNEKVSERRITASNNFGKPITVKETKDGLLAAAFHDVGLLQAYPEHETWGVLVTLELLPFYGFSADHAGRIGNMIISTRLPQQPISFIESLIADADLANLGRADFFAKGDALRRELSTVRGLNVSDEDWVNNCFWLISNQRFHTDIARQTFNNYLNLNVDQMKSRLPPKVR